MSTPQSTQSSQSLQSAVYDFAPAVWLEAHYPRKVRHGVLGVTIALFLFLILLQVGRASFFVEFLAPVNDLVTVLNAGDFLLRWASALDALLALTAALFLEVVALDAFWNWYYFRPVKVNESTIADPTSNGAGDSATVTYEVASAVLTEESRQSSATLDLTRAFVRSELGQTVLVRLGLGGGEVQQFLSAKQSVVPLSALNDLVRQGTSVDFEQLGHAVFMADKPFKELLFRQGITEADFYGALGWVVRDLHRTKRRRHWWSRKRLGRGSTFGRDFNFGRAYTLERFSRSLRGESVYEDVAGRGSEYASAYVDELEIALSKSRDTNAILVGEQGAGVMDVVVEFARRITTGRSDPIFAHRHVYLLDTNRLVSVADGKVDFERLMQRMLGEAVQAGNVILVIENFPSFLQSVGAYGSDVVSLIDAFLSTPEIQIITTASPAAYHETVERNSQFVRRFERIMVESPGVEHTVEILEDIAAGEEARHNTIVTYQALEEVARAAEHDLVEGVMPNKAIDLLLSVTAHAGEAKMRLVTKNVVQAVVQRKTGIPTGQVDETERDVLSRLEDILHQRVVVQDEAINAIAEALRRARSGLHDSGRPIGSFLFLGPTGVGKTETAKALSEAYFDGEEHLQRIDMSEYSGGGALDRLIGGPQTSGALANLAREHPYGVLLLDEFEKAGEAVHDLFLQILDEGYFSDSQGRRVNLEHYIIIATSNAGAELIMDKVEAGQDVGELTEEIVSAVIHESIFKPELVNRFDATVVYHPLRRDELRQVARLLLDRLAERIREQGYEVTFAEDVLDLLIEEGYDPKFGARAMQRVLQDRVENAIAHRILGMPGGEGKVERGDTIHLTRADL